jgi:hypothetical protein
MTRSQPVDETSFGVRLVASAWGARRAFGSVSDLACSASQPPLLPWQRRRTVARRCDVGCLEFQTASRRLNDAHTITDPPEFNLHPAKIHNHLSLLHTTHLRTPKSRAKEIASLQAVAIGSLFVSLVYCAESTVRWFVVREKHCWMAADCADKSKRTGDGLMHNQCRGLAMASCGYSELLSLIWAPPKPWTDADGRSGASKSKTNKASYCAQPAASMETCLGSRWA